MRCTAQRTYFNWRNWKKKMYQLMKD